MQADLAELWRRLAYTILINNVDGHLRNHGFLHDHGGLWRLASVFDLNPYPDRPCELRTWMSQETGPKATIEALMSVSPDFRIPFTQAKQIWVRRSVPLASVVARGLRLG